MRIHVRLFASLREAFGRERISLDLSEGATVADAWVALCTLDENFQVCRPRVLMALNRRYATLDAVHGVAEAGASERIFGRGLDGIAPDSIFLATKVGPSGPDVIRRSLENSLTNLRRDWIDLLQLHGTVFSEEQMGYILRSGGLLDQLEQAREEGVLELRKTSGGIFMKQGEAYRLLADVAGGTLAVAREFALPAATSASFEFDGRHFFIRGDDYNRTLSILDAAAPDLRVTAEIPVCRSDGGLAVADEAVFIGSGNQLLAFSRQDAGAVASARARLEIPFESAPNP